MSEALVSLTEEFVGVSEAIVCEPKRLVRVSTGLDRDGARVATPSFAYLRQIDLHDVDFRLATEHDSALIDLITGPRRAGSR